MQVLRCLPKQEILNLNVSLGRGGEACIYAVPSQSNLVAKVYHKPTAAHAYKLQAMLVNPPENPTANLGHISIAWLGCITRSRWQRSHCWLFNAADSWDASDY